MTREQWNILRRCASAQAVEAAPVALIVDSPWIPGHMGLSTLDYISVPDAWLHANLAVAREFPQIIFLPGFWCEMGMAAEPSGFGCRISFFPDQPPAPHPLTSSIEDAASLEPPNPATDGLMPLLLNYYRRVEPEIIAAGHGIKMVAARGPLTVASHVMGVSEFLLAMKLEPKLTHRFLETTTTLTRTWLEAQAAALHEVEGVLVLDDLAGFVSAKDYLEFAHPCLKRVFDAFPGAVKMFHNDTDNPVSYPHLRDLGIQLFNFTHLQPLAEVRRRVGPDLCLVGNVPPLELLARGTPDQVLASARECLSSHPGGRGLILSAGGGVSPGTPAANIRALVRAVEPPPC
ncbi:MAG: uroporphyrinogen decarboxylase family protein [Verrucomicrobia bacterium]|nr:uroporphyrinogen decarboxylase family protein [Verrucomicrobiota bacterium]